MYIQVPVIFLVIGIVYQMFFFPLNTDHHVATTIFLKRNSKKLFFFFFFLNRVTFPRADKPGLMSAYEGIALDNPEAQYVPRKRCQWPEKMGLGFAGVPAWCCGLSPTPPAGAHVLLPTP